MEILIRILFFLVPLILSVGGGWLSWQSASFWLQVTGEPKVKVISIAPESLPNGVSAKIFVPERITPDVQSQVQIESQITDASDIDQMLWILGDDCDFVWFDPSEYDVDMQQKEEPARFTIRTRNMSPPSYCTLSLYAKFDQGEKKLVTTVNLPVNAWPGKIIATAKILLGTLTAVAGLRSTIAVLFGL